jgi:type III pantothenate kinase
MGEGPVLLGIEIGNTNTLFGLFNSDDSLRTTYRLTTSRDRMPDEWFALLSTLLRSERGAIPDIDGVIISSVVPGVTPWMIDMVKRWLDVTPVVVTNDLNLGLPLDVDEPEKLGADRIVDCIAAIDRFCAPAIVVDVGTATTIDVIGRDGAYKGGAIAAGIATSLEALAGNAAQLFNVELYAPEMLIGKNTADQLRSGIVAGHLAMLEGLISKMRRELGENAPAILTGGLAELFKGQDSYFEHVEPNLTLSGLQLMYKRVHSSSVR